MLTKTSSREELGDQREKKRMLRENNDLDKMKNRKIWSYRDQQNHKQLQVSSSLKSIQPPPPALPFKYRNALAGLAGGH